MRTQSPPEDLKAKVLRTLDFHLESKEWAEVVGATVALGAAAARLQNALDTYGASK